MNCKEKKVESAVSQNLKRDKEICIKVSKEERELYKRTARYLNTTVSGLIRTAVREYLNTHLSGEIDEQ